MGAEDEGKGKSFWEGMGRREISQPVCVLVRADNMGNGNRGKYKRS